MNWFGSLIVLSTGVLFGAVLKHIIWRTSHNGIRGWFRRRKYHARQLWKVYRRAKLKQKLSYD